MSFFFRNPTNLELASRLKQNALHCRNKTWTDAIYSLARVYQTPKDNFERAVNQDGAERYDRNFLLIQESLETITPADLNGNYGYILAHGSTQPYLVIPVQSGIIFEIVENKTIHAELCDLIRSDDARIREARDEDMDRILQLFYADQAESLMGTPDFLKRKKTICYSGDGKFRSALHAPNAYAYKQHLINYTAKELQLTVDMSNRTGLTDINLEQTRAKTLLETSWFSRAREHFSWTPLAEAP